MHRLIGLLGIDFKNPVSTSDIMQITGPGNLLFNGTRFLGDPNNGQKRGIAGNAPNITVHWSYFAGIWQPAQDTQAFCAWDSAGPFVIDDNYMEAASENILFGGADASSDANIPTNIRITNNLLTKNLAWQTQRVQVKNCLELKAARKVLITSARLAAISMSMKSITMMPPMSRSRS